MRTHSIAILLLLSFNIIFSQQENLPLITVTGESSIKTYPDYVIIGVEINKQLRTDTRGIPIGFDVFDEKDTKICLYDLDDDEIYTSIIQINNEIYVKEVFITIRDLNRLDKYLVDLKKLGFSNYIHFDYRVNDYASLKKQANKTAITNAKIEAKELASQLGQAIGKAHAIKELDTRNYNWYTTPNKTDFDHITFDQGADDYLTEPGYIIITSKIEVSFDLLK